MVWIACKTWCRYWSALDVEEFSQYEHAADGIDDRLAEGKQNPKNRKAIEESHKTALVEESKQNNI